VRLRNLGAAIGEAGEWRKTNLGTFVLFSLLVITAALTLVFVLGPLLLARGRLLGTETGPRLAALAYFAGLGAGFIVLEVSLVQKCILFLGHPVYALAVVLFSLLAFSGAGSYLSGHVSDARLRAALPRALLTLVGFVVLYVLLLSPAFYALVQLPRPWRIAIAVVLLFPLGLVMGMPMPIGVRVLAREAPELIPWAWGVNGAASVMGSVGALAIALLAGFDQAMLVGAAAYLGALACQRRGWAAAGPNARP
jgi:predicted membrane-bound spermidine synthase